MVKGSIPSLQTWEERQGVSPPRHLSPTSSGLKRSRPVSSGVRSSEEVSRLLGQTEREVIIESRAETRQQLPQQQPPPPPPPPPPGKESDGNGLSLYSTPTLAKLAKTPHCTQPPKVMPSRLSVNSSDSSASVNGESFSASVNNRRQWRQQSGGSTGADSCSSSGTVSPRLADGVETQSLDSFTLEHPSATAPKPPPTYFDGAPAKKREALVTIGAYGDNRPTPTRLHFLGEQKREQDEADGGKFEEVAMQLQQELVQTLSRANLRHRSGSVDNLLTASDSAATRRTVLDKYGSALNVSDASAETGPGGILKHGQ